MAAFCASTYEARLFSKAATLADRDAESELAFQDYADKADSSELAFQDYADKAARSELDFDYQAAVSFLKASKLVPRLAKVYVVAVVAAVSTGDGAGAGPQAST